MCHSLVGSEMCIRDSINMGPPEAVDREFVYIDFSSAFVLVLALSSFFLLPSFFFHFSSSCPISAPSGAILAPSWAPLVSILSHLGRILSHPGSILAPQNVFLEPDHHFIEVFLKVTFGNAIRMPRFCSTLHFIKVKIVFPFGQEFSETT